MRRRAEGEEGGGARRKRGTRRRGELASVRQGEHLEGEAGAHVPCVIRSLRSGPLEMAKDQGARALFANPSKMLFHNLRWVQFTRLLALLLSNRTHRSNSKVEIFSRQSLAYRKMEECVENVLD